MISVSSRLEVEGLVFYITELKKNILSGICYSEFIGEHISYLLNNDDYKVDRKNRLSAAGYDYSTVQQRVNEMLG